MTLSICSIFRNESLYLREWVEFHRIVGVEKFYLYQNRSDDDYLSVLQPYIDSGVVELIEWNINPPCQVEAYNHYINSHIGVSEWTAFIDIDEFLFSPSHNTITEVLSSFPSSVSISVSWMCFGSSGKQSWEPLPVIERFTLRPPADIPSNHLVKPIVNLNRPFTIGNPHYADVPTITPLGKQSYGGNTIPPEHSLLRINHYGTKSRDEWVKRQLLGKPCAPFTASPEACYIEVQGNIEDRDIQRFLPELKERLI